MANKKGNKKLYVFDTTLRDGEQTPSVSFSVEEKLELANQLTKLGVDVIEAGFPISSKFELNAVKTISEKIGREKEVVICGLARCQREDIDAAWEGVKSSQYPRIHTFIATSDLHIKYKLAKTHKEVLELAKFAVRYAKDKGCQVEFSPEDATRSNVEFLYEVLEEAIKEGADVINIPDTVGYAMPWEFASLIEKIKSNVRGIDKVILSVHCHNDLGLAVANTLAAVKAGAEQVECTINGLGERAGNAALEEVVMAINTRKTEFNLTVDIKTSEIYPTSRLVSRLSAISVQPNKAIVGANAFSHTGGIHQDGVLKLPSTYEIMRASSVGFPSSHIILGKLSGRHALSKRLSTFGFSFTKEELEEIYKKFKEIANKKKYVYDEDLYALGEELLQEKGRKNYYTLEYLHVTCGKDIMPTATIRLRKDNEIYHAAACGNGPVDATYKAIDEITKKKMKLLDYTLRALSADRDALGEVTLRVKYKKRIAIGKGSSTDIVEASAKAYLSAINRLIF